MSIKSTAATPVAAQSLSSLVQLHNGVPMTSSLQVAQTFGKEHRRVLQSIRDLDCSSDFRAHHFVQSFYIREIEDRGQRKYPLYYLTRDGFTFLVMGFTGKVAAQFKEDYINAFNAMEQKLKTSVATRVHPSRESLRASIRRALEEGCKQAEDAYALKWYREQYEKEHRAAERLRLSLTSIAHQLQSVGIRSEIG